MKYRVGVIGATGFIGTPYRQQIREANQDASIVALCSRRKELLQKAAKEDGASFITGDWREIVEHPEVDLVLVVTPDALHHEIVMSCAENRKHVICDKPIGLNVNEAYQMWSAYRSSGLGHFVPFWTRYVEVFAKVKEIVKNGTLGEIKCVVCRWHNPRPAAMPFTWRDDATLSSSGSIGDLGSHAYDTIRWITGDEALRVITHAGVIGGDKPDLGEPNLDEALKWGTSHLTGDSRSHKSGTAFDYGSISVQFNSGAVGYFMVSHATDLRKGISPEMELHGTKASLGIERWTGKLVLTLPDSDPEVIYTQSDDILEPRNDFKQFAFPGIRQRSSGTGQDYPGLDDGWRAQLFTDAASLSAHRGTWVSIEELEP